MGWLGSLNAIKQGKLLDIIGALQTLFHCFFPSACPISSLRLSRNRKIGFALRNNSSLPGTWGISGIILLAAMCLELWGRYT